LIDDVTTTNIQQRDKV